MSTSVGERRATFANAQVAALAKKPAREYIRGSASMRSRSRWFRQENSRVIMSKLAIVSAAFLCVSNAPPEMDPLATKLWALQPGMTEVLDFPPSQRSALADNGKSVSMPLLSCRSGRDGSIPSFIRTVGSRYSRTGIIHLATEIFVDDDSDYVEAVMTYRITADGGRLATREATAFIDLRDCSTRAFAFRS
jgi:hypothetical protein